MNLSKRYKGPVPRKAKHDINSHFFLLRSSKAIRNRSAEQSSDLLVASHLAIAALDVIQATKA